MEFLVTAYLPKKCLPRFLLNKQRKFVSLNEVSKDPGIYKKPIPLIEGTSTYNSNQRSADFIYDSFLNREILF